MAKDSRYKIIKPMFSDGEIKSFAQIFEYIPKTVVANDLGLNVNRFSQSIKNVENLRIRDILQLADLLNLKPMEIFGLIDKQLGATP